MDDIDREELAVLSTKVDGLVRLINYRFDRADEDRRDLSDRVDKIDGRFWKIILCVSGVAVLELLRLITK